MSASCVVVEVIVVLTPPVPDANYTIDLNGTGGNSISIVTLRAGAQRRTLHLLATASAEGFGVERGLLWHSVVWRETTTRRFLFGLAQKTEYHIWGEVAYTTDAWRSSQVWCAYDIYGPLDVSDPRAQANYSDQAESASSIFAGCQHRTGKGAVPYPTTPPAQAPQ